VSIGVNHLLNQVNFVSGQTLGQSFSQTPWHPYPVLNICRVLQISLKHFKISKYQSCVVFHGTQLRCWVTFQIQSGKWWKSWSTTENTISKCRENVKVGMQCVQNLLIKTPKRLCKVVEVQEIYNFGIYTLEHFCCKILRKNTVKLAYPELYLCRNTRARMTSHERHVGCPSYAGLCAPAWALYSDACRATGRCHTVGTRRSATHTLAIDSPPRRMSPPPLRPYRDHVVDLTHTNCLSAHPIAIKTLPFPCRVSTTPPQSVIAAALTSTYLCSLPQPPNTSSTFHRTSSILLTHLFPFTTPRFAEFWAVAAAPPLPHRRRSTEPPPAKPQPPIDEW
jgi:hypothetical protein